MDWVSQKCNADSPLRPLAAAAAAAANNHCLALSGLMMGRLPPAGKQVGK
jgi:hypothetical protein